MPSTDFSWLIKGQLWRQGVYFALHFIRPVFFGGSCHVFTGVIANDLPFGQSRHCSSNGVWPFCPQKGVGKHLHFLSWSYLPLHFPWADGWSDNLVINCLNFCQVIRKPQSEVTGSTFAHALSAGGKRKIIREAAAQSNSGPQLDNLKKIDARLCLIIVMSHPWMLRSRNFQTESRFKYTATLGLLMARDEFFQPFNYTWIVRSLRERLI